MRKATNIHIHNTHTQAEKAEYKQEELRQFWEEYQKTAQEDLKTFWEDYQREAREELEKTADSIHNYSN